MENNLNNCELKPQLGECYLRREAIDHVGVSDQNQVQPTTAPPSARRHADLSPSGL